MKRAGIYWGIVWVFVFAGELRAAPLFSFAVSGDSRNCGDVVVPAIARHVGDAKFYWHLGDFRLMYDVDEDIVDRFQKEGKPTPEIHEYYDKIAWNDFLENQVRKFKVPVYLLPGNHEMAYPAPHYPDSTPLERITPKTTKDYVTTFAAYRPANADNKEHPYYSWTDGPVAFIALDNSVGNDFDADQVRWFDSTLESALKDEEIKTIVVGMHEALPDSIAANHSMDQAKSKAFGDHVYHALVLAQNGNHKHVYVLASHSHYFMDGTFNNHPQTDRLPGWIVGTAGAQRYPLPEGEVRAIDAARKTHPLSNDARTHVYGFMTGSVRSDGNILFRFTPLSRNDLKDAAGVGFSEKLIDDCFDHNQK